MQLPLAALRVVQLLFSIVVLALAVTLAKKQVFGHVPATTGYEAFSGAFGIIAALVGFVALFVELVQGPIGWLVDGLATLIMLAGGIAWVIGLRHTDCGDVFTLDNDLLVGGRSKEHGENVIGITDEADLMNRCRIAKADEAFVWMTFIVSAAALVLSFVVGRRRGTNRYVV